MTLEEMLALAKWAVQLTRTVIPVSSNLPDPKRTLSHRRVQMGLARRRGETPEQKALINEIHNWNMDLSSNIERYPLNAAEFYVSTLNRYLTLKEISAELESLPNRSSKPRDALRSVEAAAVKALKYGIGNCGETSCYAFLLLTEYPKEGLPGLPKIDRKINIERVAFPGEDDHAFIVINRDQNTDLSNAWSWNPDAIICDPWTEEVYTVYDLYKNKDAESIIAINKKFSNIQKNLPTNHQESYLGENYNNRVHSADWEKNIMVLSIGDRDVYMISSKDQKQSRNYRNIESDLKYQY